MNPYRIDEPWILSFSGGKTSGFMLRNVLDANGGVPDGCRVVFANTGKERPETLDFIDRVSTEWSVPIDWIERRMNSESGFAVVDHATASRNGEPFAELIAKKRYLPNAIARFCTEELKVKAIAMFCKSVGITDATMLVGLRADEQRRVRKVHGDERQGFFYDCPMHRAGHVLADVERFWATQDFRLNLPDGDPAFTNCDLCFLKSKERIARVIRNDPESAAWWIAQEDSIGRTFRKDRLTYRQMLVQVRIQPEMFGKDDDDDSTIPCTCTD